MGTPVESGAKVWGIQDLSARKPGGGCLPRVRKPGRAPSGPLRQWLVFLEHRDGAMPRIHGVFGPIGPGRLAAHSWHIVGPLFPEMAMTTGAGFPPAGACAVWAGPSGPAPVDTPPAKAGTAAPAIHPIISAARIRGGRRPRVGGRWFLRTSSKFRRAVVLSDHRGSELLV